MPTTDSDARFWDRAARKYAAAKIADPDGYERTLERARHYLKPEHAVFEFGCGTGTTALKLASSVTRYVATDVSAEMVAIGREKAAAEGVRNIEFLAAAPGAASQPDASFGAAMAFNVLHLIEARAAVYSAVHKLLKPGGLFISKTPCLSEMNPIFRLLVPVMQVFGRAPYVAFFSAQELEREIAAAGFEIVERDRHGSKRKDARIFLVARKV